ncbi:PspC domain-containing protein [Streptacidiphilus cavernicola]|uniref:PspC domain-containing protein n=1 Tax=Streptacidiphilus cavernicola TaxID=3342716 RepID=A0ABV6VTR0_9ACTN
MTDTPPPATDAPPEDAAPEQPRPARPPLERSRDRRVVAGVCGGLGRHLDIDPVVFRVVIAVLCVSGGVGLFIYGLAWLIVPVERTRRNELQRLLSGRVDGQSLGAVLVTVLGTGIFFSYMGSSGHLFPLLLIALLAFAALRYDPAKHPRRSRQAVPGLSADGEQEGSAGFEGTIFGVAFRTTPKAPEEQPTVPVPPAAPSWWQRPDPLRKDPLRKDPLREEPPREDDPGEDGDTAVDREPAAGPGDTPPWRPYQPPAPPYPARPAREPRQRSFLGSAFFFLALITGGTVWWAAARQHHQVDVLTVLASALLVLGVGLLVCSRWGRGRSLAVWATLLTLAVAAVGASPVKLNTSFQRTVWTPATATALLPSYDLSAGQGTLDLSGLTPAPGQSLSTDVHVGVGQLRVILPPGSRVEITAHVGVGSIRLPDGSDSGGLSSNRSTELNPGAAAQHGTINLELNVGAGDVEVNQ